MCVISTATPEAVLNADGLLDWRKLWTELWAFLIFDLALRPLKVPGGSTSVPAFPPPSQTRLGSSSTHCRFLFIRATPRWSYSGVFWKLGWRKASSGSFTVNSANLPCAHFDISPPKDRRCIESWHQRCLIASSPSRSAFIPLRFQHKQIWERRRMTSEGRRLLFRPLCSAWRTQSSGLWEVWSFFFLVFFFSSPDGLH